MDANKYLTKTCMWEHAAETDAEFLSPVYSESEQIQCFKYGDIKNIRTSDTVDDLSDQTYLVTAPVKAGDKIDGQMVKRVGEYYDFDGTIVMYEVHVLRE